MLLQRLAIYHPLNLNVMMYVKRCVNQSRVFQDTKMLNIYHHSHAHSSTEVRDAELMLDHLSFQLKSYPVTSAIHCPP